MIKHVTVTDFASASPAPDAGAGSDPARRAAAANAALEGATAQEVLAWVSSTFDRWAVASSMGDTVLAHLAATVRPGVDVLFLDTGYHFTETLGTADAVKHTYPVNLVTITPEHSVAEQDAREGKDLFATNPDRCCALRKTAPLDRALTGYQAWVTGARRAESAARADTPIVQWDAQRSIMRINPLATWSDEQVSDYAGEHQVILNPLLLMDYPSIGCEPCTRPVTDGQDPRSGRWAGLGKTECGILQ